MDAGYLDIHCRQTHINSRRFDSDPLQSKMTLKRIVCITIFLCFYTVIMPKLCCVCEDYTSKKRTFHKYVPHCVDFCLHRYLSNEAASAI